MKTAEKGTKLASCVSCRARKIKCDTQFPCASCLRGGIACVPNIYNAIPRGRKGGRKPLADEVKKRIANLERLVQTMQNQTPTQASAPSTIEENVANPVRETFQPPRSPDGPSALHPGIECALSDDFSNSEHTGLGGSYWISLNKEIAGLREVFGDLSDDEVEAADFSQHSNETLVSLNSSGWDSGLPDPISFHFESGLNFETPRLHASILCSVYVEKIDSIFKVVHCPSLVPYLEGGKLYLDRRKDDPAVQALTLAVFYAAVTGLSEEECWQKFEQTRSDLLQKYRHALNKALALADWINTGDLITLQALVVFLLCVRTNDNSRFTWTLIGLAVRIAHALGLHRDVTNRLLPVFERELRRRLWWQLCVLDVQASNDRASDPCILAGTFDTPMPMNIDDEDIKFGDTNEISPRQGLTPMTLSLITFELAEVLREVMYVPPAISTQNEAELDFDRDRKLGLIAATRERLEHTYLKPHEADASFHDVASKVINLCLGMMWLTACRPLRNRSRASRRSGPDEKLVLETSVRVLEVALQIDGMPRMKWLAATYVQWHALAVTLAGLCTIQDGYFFRRAWKAVNAIFDRSADRIADSVSGLLWRPIRKLMIKAQSRLIMMKRSDATLQWGHSRHFLNIPFEDNLVPQHSNEFHITAAQISLPNNLTGNSIDPQFAFESPWILQPQSDVDASVSNLGGEELVGGKEWESFIEDFFKQS